ncbi:hypothetical protein MBLNU457_g0543t1 [Dothideomycetes sp. NU457]
MASDLVAHVESVIENDQAASKKKVKFDFEGFFKDQDFPDLTIKFSGTEINAHRYLVGRKSSWFKMTCSGPFKEVQDRVIELHEDDPAAVRAMLLFLYDKPYANACEDASEDLLFFTRVFTIADKYDVDELKDVVTADLEVLLPGLWNHEHFFQAISEVYDLPDSRHACRLKLAIENTCWENIHALMAKSAFADVCQVFPELQYKLLQQSTDSLRIYEDAASADGPDQVAFACDHCTALFGELWWRSHKKAPTFKLEGAHFYMDCPRCQEPVWSSERMNKGKETKYFYK